MKTTTPAKDAREVFEIWRREDGELSARLDAIRCFMVSEASPDSSCCANVARRLNEFREYLVNHFSAEDKLSDQLAGFYPKASPEIQAMKRQSTRDHQRLLGQLDELVGNLSQSKPHFDSWKAAIEKVEWFVDLLEQHEDQEAESVSALMPHDC